MPNSSQTHQPTTVQSRSQIKSWFWKRLTQFALFWICCQCFDITWETSLVCARHQCVRQPLYHNVFSILSPRLLIWTAWTVIDNNLYTRCANSDWAQSLGCIFSWMRLESAEMRKYVTQIQPENQQKWPVMPFWFRFRWTRKLNADLNMNDEKCDSRLNASPIY